MMDREPEAGHELVLDNRKLILAFAVLIAICGAFFVVGFMEGRRQGFQDGMQTAVETAPGAAGAQAEGSGAEAPPAAKQEIDPSDLDWYRNVNRAEGDPGGAPRLTEPAPQESAAPKAETAREAAPPKAPARMADAQAAVSSYSVQVGAFRARREAETVGRELREKGFTGRIEVPDSPDGFYLVKVGKFGTRAEAAAMQLRLKSNGFQCFVKTN